MASEARNTNGITYIRTKGIKYSIWEEKCTKRVRNTTVAVMREIAWGAWVVYDLYSAFKSPSLKL